MSKLLQDIRYTLRLVRRSPGFALAVVLTLTLGIGGNAALFSVIHNVFLQPLPFSDEEQLVRLRDMMRGPEGEHAFNTLERNFYELQQSGVFAGMTAQRLQNATLTNLETPERVSMVQVSPRSWEVLGVKPVIGRVFSEEEERAGRDSGVALIAHSLWVTRFGGDESALGKKLELDQRIYTIVGVLPRGYEFPYGATVWLPMTINPANPASAAVFARLRPDKTLEQTATELKTIAARIEQKYPDIKGYGVQMEPLRKSLIAEEDRIAVVMFAAVGFLLLMSCVNVANLLLARSITRQREFAIRAAVGAGRGRQIRQLITESVVLALMGAGGGALLAAWFGSSLLTLVPMNLANQLGLIQVGLNSQVAVYMAAAALLTGVLCGLLPALRSSRLNLSAALKEGNASNIGGTRNRRALSVFVVAEIALALVLLTGAAVMVGNFERLSSKELGLQAKGLLTTRITLPPHYNTPELRVNAVQQIVQNVAQTPGVAGVGISTMNPLTGGTWHAPVLPDDYAGNDDGYIVNFRLISGELFSAWQTPLLQGRTFQPTDTVRSEPVAIISKRTADRIWPGESPLGKRLRFGRDESPIHVVGVVGDIEDNGDMRETLYLPYAQLATGGAGQGFHLMIRSGNVDPNSLVRSTERAVWDFDPKLALFETSTMDRIHAENYTRERVGAIAVSMFAAFGMILAVLGTYGVMSYAVNQRMHEIGLRLALGAERRDIFLLVLRQGVLLAALGIAIGTLAGLGLDRFITGLLPDSGGFNASLLMAAAAALLIVALVACYVPARRATQVDPLVALRYE